MKALINERYKRKRLAGLLLLALGLSLSACDKGKKPYEEAEAQFSKSDYAAAKSKAAEVVQNSPQSKYVAQAKGLNEKITRVEVLLSTAKEALQIEDYKQAIKNYEEILSVKNNPKNSVEIDTLQKTKEAYKKQLMDDGTLLYVDNGDYEKGIECYKETLRYFPNDINATAALKQAERTYSNLKQLGDEVMEQLRIFVQAAGTRNDDVATVANARYRELAKSLYKINGGRPYLTLRINEYLSEGEIALNDFLSKSKAVQRVERRDQRIIAADDYNHALTKFTANYGRPEAWLEGEMNKVMKEKKGWDMLPLYHDDEENLSDAAYNGQFSIVRSLLAAGTNVNAKDGQGYTTLKWATQKGHLEIVKLLIERGAILDAKDNTGWTSLMSAANSGHIEIAKLLIEKGANINASNREGCTPLRFAAANGRTEIAKILIEKGADINAKDNEGVTPLKRAVEKGHKAIAELLRSYGAKE